MSCSLEPAPHCDTTEPVDPGDTLIMTVSVDVAPSLASSVPNGAAISGGGAASASVSEPLTIGSALPEYGVAPGGLFAAASTSQAGAHPNVTTAVFLNTVNRKEQRFESRAGRRIPKDIGFDLPPGLGRHHGRDAALHDGRSHQRSELSRRYDGGDRRPSSPGPQTGVSPSRCRCTTSPPRRGSPRRSPSTWRCSPCGWIRACSPTVTTGCVLPSRT